MAVFTSGCYEESLKLVSYNTNILCCVLQLLHYILVATQRNRLIYITYYQTKKQVLNLLLFTS